MEKLLSNYKPLAPLLVIICSISLLEIGLEYRHYLRGYQTPIFGTKVSDAAGALQRSESSSTLPQSLYGPTKDWPYRSKIADIDLLSELYKNPPVSAEKHLLIWIASASHAEHRRFKAEVVFPNRMCDLLQASDDRCLVVNGSRAGDTIARNLTTMRKSAFIEKVDYAVLYQMAMFLATEQTLQLRATSAKNIADSDTGSKPSVEERIKKTLQRTSIYSHLSEYVGSTIKLASFREDHLPDVSIRWQKELLSFLSYCQQNGIQPILTTFAASFDVDNIQSMPVSLQRTLVRENKTLSPKAYVRTVKQLNDVTQQLAMEHNVLLVDVAGSMGGQPGLFVDMVHFNQNGHEKIAEILVNAIIGNSKTEAQR